MPPIDKLLTATTPFLNDGGIETTLIFHEGFNLPMFSAFVLYDSPQGCAALERYFGRYMDMAEQSGRGFLLDTATWRANAGWAGRLGLSEQDVRNVNRRAVEMARRLRAGRATADTILISGTIGPTGDGYSPDRLLTPDRAETLHRPQIEALAQARADLITALTMTHVGEAIGVARAASAAQIPVALSFTVETDGRLPDGTDLGSAIAAVDAATEASPVYYGINCAHPTHFLDQLSGEWTKRIGAIRANASRRSHAELDEATELDVGDPQEFGGLYEQLGRLLPNLRVVGGCCGTDHRHVAAAVGLH